MIKYDGTEIKSLDFTDLYVMNTWTNKMILEIKEIGKDLEYCKHKILMAKWDKIIYWYPEMCHRIMNGPTSIEEFMVSIRKIIEDYEKVIYADTRIATKIYTIFKELHEVATTEFIGAIKQLLDDHQKKFITTTDLINSIGKNLHLLLINSVFEISEISIKCPNTNCPYYIEEEDQSVRFLISDLYALNSFSIYKLEKFIKLLDTDIAKIDFVADFRYFSEKEVNPNIFIMLDKIRDGFKSLRITKLNAYISNATIKRFPENVEKL